MARAYLSLGSNLGDRRQNLADAVSRLDTTDCRILAVSCVYETTPVGETPEPVPDYLNIVIAVETNLDPEALLKHTQAVEQAGRREKSFRWGPRTIDVDILLYEGVRMATDQLELPHPRMMGRSFVLIPLAEIAPDLVLPNGMTAKVASEGASIQGQTVSKVGTLS